MQSSVDRTLATTRKENFFFMKTKDIVNIAMFATLLSVCAWIYIPMTIPFTMQTFAVFLAIFVLGGKRGILVISIYLFLGLIGMPVFSGGTAGPGVIFGPTGGYMIGWIFIGLLVWLSENLAVRREADKKRFQLPVMAAGLFLSYLTGTLWYMFIYAKDQTQAGMMTVIATCVLPYIIPDIIKLTLACSVSKRIKKFIANV